MSGALWVFAFVTLAALFVVGCEAAIRNSTPAVVRRLEAKLDSLRDEVAVLRAAELTEMRSRLPRAAPTDTLVFRVALSDTSLLDGVAR